FDEQGEEYVVDSPFTAQWRFTPDIFNRARAAIDTLITGDGEVMIGKEGHQKKVSGYGLEYDEKVTKRENKQIAFKLEADPARRTELGKQVEELLNEHVFVGEGIRFKYEISGKSTISLMVVAEKPTGVADVST